MTNAKNNSIKKVNIVLKTVVITVILMLLWVIGKSALYFFNLL